MLHVDGKHNHNDMPKYVKIACLINLLVFVSFFTINYTSFGSIVMMGLSVMSVLVMAMNKNGKIHFKWNTYYTFMLVFIAYSYVSVIWAMDPSDPIGKATTLVKCLLIIVMLMIVYEKLKDVGIILWTIMLSGYGVVIYSVLTYGISTMRTVLQDSTRLDSVFANVNTVGTLAAFSVVVSAYFLLNQKVKWYCIIPSAMCVYVIAATASRKALVALVLGVVFVFFFYKDSRNISKKVYRLLITIAVIFIILQVLSRLSMFKSVMARMETMINMFLGSGQVDRSARVRNTMIELGIEQFYKTPILGIGIGGGHQINYRDAYLHNNFIEILVGGGLIGFCVYYAMYVYLLFSYKKYWKWRDDYTRICIILFVLLLMLDYGSVSYAEKHTFFYQALLFLNVKHMKQKSKKGNLNYEHKKAIA